MPIVFVVVRFLDRPILHVGSNNVARKRNYCGDYGYAQGLTVILQVPTLNGRDAQGVQGPLFRPQIQTRLPAGRVGSSLVTGCRVDIYYRGLR